MDGKLESLSQDLEFPNIISARLTAPTLQGGEQNTNPGSKPGASDRWTFASGRTVEGISPGLSKPGASGSEQKWQGRKCWKLMLSGHILALLPHQLLRK